MTTAEDHAGVAFGDAPPPLPLAGGAGAPPGPCRQGTLFGGVACSWPSCACYPTAEVELEPTPAEPMCVRCKRRPPTWRRRHASRALCGPCYTTCACCGEPRDTRHRGRSELCRRCYHEAVKALQAILLDPTAREEVLQAVQVAAQSQRKILARPHPRGPRGLQAALVHGSLERLAIALGGGL